MLQAEMDGHVSTQIQLMDQEHCLLEYIRDKANLCCEQAKVSIHYMHTATYITTHVKSIL